MREAYSGQFGQAPYGTQNVGGGDVDRLSNLRRAIDSIEQRIASQPPAMAMPSYSQPAMQGPSGDADLGLIQQQINRLSNQIGTPTPVAPVAPATPQIDAATAEILRRQQALNQPDNSEQQALAEHTQALANQTLAQQRQAMDVISKQFDLLKAELSSLKEGVANPITVQPKMKKEEIDRLARSISSLQTTPGFDDAAFEKLAKELGQLRSSMRHDVRKEMAVARNINERLDALANGVDAMAAQAANAVTPRVDNLAAQLDAMRMTIDDLPQTLAITRLEERLAKMAAKIENIPTEFPKPKEMGKEIASIEGRLDEIARALVAVSNMGNNVPEVDLSGLDRLDARLQELSQNVDVIAKTRLDTLENDQVQGLARRIEGLTERLGSFEKYAEAGDLGGATAMFAGPDTGVIEEQLQHLTTRLDEASAVSSTAAQISNLEAQIGQILRHLNKEEVPIPVDLAPVEQRLVGIENQIVNAHQNTVEAAQHAAQQAVAMLGAQSDSGQVISALSQDLKSLQTVAESGSAKTGQSINDVHNMLGQVIERLGSIEKNVSKSQARIAKQVDEDEARMPPAATIDPNGALEEQATVAVKAANHVIDSVKPVQTSNPSINYSIEPTGFDDEPIDTRSMSAPPIDPVDQMDAHMASSGGAPENHEPIEPGADGPDLNKLVEEASARLEEAKASYGSGDASYGSGADNIRPDPVGAARRALQATTAEMNAVRDEVAADQKQGKPPSSSLLSRLSGGSLRKPIVVAAAATLLIVLASFGYKQFMDGDRKVAKVSKPAIEKTVKPVKSKKTPTAKPKAEATPGTDSKVVRSVDGSNSALSGSGVQPQSADSGIIQGDDSTPVETALAEPKIAPKTPVPPKTAAQQESVKPIEQANVAPVAPEVTAPTTAPTTSRATFDVPSDVGPAALIAAASAGEPKALFELGMRYSNGKSVKRNMVESSKWFSRAAEAGFAPAQYSIGSLYEKGIGIEKDVKTAESWYEKAALQGNARAMHNLAVINAMGNAGEPNMDKAVRWFVDAANFGIKDSQFNLGILYGQGMGVPQNLKESYKWFALAAKTGDTDAAAKRDEVANAMDPTDLADARKIVADWQPAPLEEAVNRVAVPKEWRGKGSGATASTGVAQVRQAQVLLKERGFDVGTPDGLMGPKTKRAIMDFQQASGIPVTGKVDQKLLQALDLQT